MTCPKCNGNNVNVTTEQTSASTRTRGMGCLWTIGRWFLILCTLGLWLIIGKRKKTSKTTFRNQTIAICQNCGNKWNV